MRQVRWASWLVGLAMTLAVCGVRPAAADVRSDQAAAILEWPSVLFSVELISQLTDFSVLDTVIQLSNTSDTPVDVHCFYENANSHCTNTGFACVFPQECCDMTTGCGVCLPGWSETDFNVRLTPFQPLGWLASEGLAGFDTIPPKDFDKFPLDGVTLSGPDGSSNAGSRIPPIAEEPFNGSLRCIAVDEDGIPVDRNVLKGEETLEVIGTGRRGDDDFDFITVAKSNAIGIQAIPGANNGDNILVLGGPDAEYNGCPNFLILNHFFDFAINPAAELGPVDSGPIFTFLTVVPCTQDFLRQIPGSAVLQFLVFNEFEQRFSTSRTVACKAILPLSLIDTTQPQRSIFSAGISGTLTGQTRINPIGSGMLAVATELHDGFGIDEFNVHIQGDRDTPDTITLP